MAKKASPASVTMACALTPGQTPAGFIAPLFWQHGEPAVVLREEMQQMRSVGIRQCIVEARSDYTVPIADRHLLDFAGPEWWEIVDTIVDEAERLGMKIWFFDDVLFPSGYAAGRIRDRYPHLLKVFLAERLIDACGPLPGASFRVQGWLHGDEQLVGVVAARRVDPDGDALDGSTLVDLTDQVLEGRLYWDVPEGWWRVSILVRTRRGAESDWTSDYGNPLVAEAADVLAAELWEPHYRRYEKKFGSTILGFFDDEARFGNAGTYEAVLGRYKMVLPWCDDLLAELDQGWPGGFRRVIPALWHDAGEVSSVARYRFMDVVSRRFSRNYMGRLGDWCRRHGVQLIGHVVEDNNAHARLGYGAGHFFRATAGMDMGGLDLVYQVWPGMLDGRQQTPFGAWDLAFFYWGVAKLASSAAHLDPRKAGRTMCEIFGAYGWQFTLADMKWLTDHACVRGVNFLVPHAFSPKYPDPDCPPHFYARGANPQWRHFGVWSAYAERVCHLLSGGEHVAPVAVLYHAEAEWAGGCEHFHHAVRALAERQIDCDVAPIDMLIDEQLTHLADGSFTINRERFGCLVVPFAQRLPLACLRRLGQLVQAGVRVIFTGDLPVAASDAEDASNELALLRRHPLVAVRPLAELAEALRAWRLAGDVSVEPASPHLRLYRYRRSDMDLWFCVNEDPRRAVDATVRFRDRREPLGYDAMADAVIRVDSKHEADETAVRLRLSPYASLFVVFADRPSDLSAPLPPATFIDDLCEVTAVNWEWTISTATVQTYPTFTPRPGIKTLGDLSRPGLLRGFGGVIAYETAVEIPPGAGGDLWLDLGTLHQVGEVFLDGRRLGVRICPPHLYDLGQVAAGRGRLRIEVTTTLVDVHGDGNGFDRGLPHKPMGLQGPVRLLRSSRTRGGEER
jgi:hypothetical protein